MKNVIRYILSIFLALLSVPIYVFVGYSSANPTRPFEYTAFNIIVYKIIPLVIALIMTFVSYYLYLKKTPKDKSLWFLFFEIPNFILMGFLVYAGFFLWEASGDFFGAIILSFLAIILQLVSLIPFIIRIRTALNKKKPTEAI